MLVVFGAAHAFGTEWATIESETYRTSPAVLAGAAHFPWFEQPEAFYASLKPFVATNVGP